MTDFRGSAGRVLHLRAFVHATTSELLSSPTAARRCEALDAVDNEPLRPLPLAVELPLSATRNAGRARNSRKVGRKKAGPSNMGLWNVRVRVSNSVSFGKHPNPEVKPPKRM